MRAFFALIIALSFLSSQEFRMGCTPERELRAGIQISPDIRPYQHRDAHDFSADMPPISSQGGQGSCTAWATGYYYKSYQEWQEQGWEYTDEHRYSPAFVYNLINGGSDSGSSISTAFLLMQDMGFATLAAMPYNDNDYFTWPCEEQFENAMPSRSETTYAIHLQSNLQDLLDLLSTGNAAVLGYDVYGSFGGISDYNYVYALATLGGGYSGGHAVCAVGFDDNMPTPDGAGAVKFTNSWGQGWGDEGFFWMSYEFLQSQYAHGYAYYSSDRIAYEPQFVASIGAEYDDRGQLGLAIVSPDAGAENWRQSIMPWLASKQTHEWPSCNILVDLSDAATEFDFSAGMNFTLKAKDKRHFWLRSPEGSFDGSSYWCADPDIGGYGNGWLMDLATDEVQLGASDNSFSFQLRYAIEDPAEYQGYDGWDVGTVFISEDGGSNWQPIEGTLPYNVSAAWAYNFHGIEGFYPGWAGVSADWQHVVFDLDDYAEQSVMLKIRFISDGGWCTLDNPDYFGMGVDELAILADGELQYWDSADQNREGSLTHFSVRSLASDWESISNDTPVVIPADENYAYASLFFAEAQIGDVNQDYEINVLDVVALVNIILEASELNESEMYLSDQNSDGTINIQDVIMLINFIMEI